MIRVLRIAAVKLVLHVPFAVRAHVVSGQCCVVVAARAESGETGVVSFVGEAVGGLAAVFDAVVIHSASLRPARAHGRHRG